MVVINFSQYGFNWRTMLLGKAEANIKTSKLFLLWHLDHDEENHDVQLDRLKALCQLCHLRYDAREKYRRSLTKWKKS